MSCLPVMWLALLSLALAWAEPSDHTVIFYNARMALREGQPVEAIHLWLLRNALEDRTGHVSVHDADFRSVTWAALGETGICQDGLARDDDGVGLWPIALHNWVVRNRGHRRGQRRGRPFDAFQLDRQQRFVALGDVLSSQELQAVHLARGRCGRWRLALVEAGESVTARLSDRQVAARLLRHLLVRARETLDADRVRGQAVIDARLFDIDLQLTELAAREARQLSRERAREGRAIGLARGSLAAMARSAPRTTLSPSSEAARILQECVDWPVSEWMALEADRRLFLFANARTQGGDPDKLNRIALGIIDRLLLEGDGAEVEKWIAWLGEDADRSAVWGARGAQLMALDRDSGFRERSVIALHRGVDHLERGELPEALRAMAFALQHAPESREADSVHKLSRRWLSYVAARFEVTDDLLITLQQLLPRRDYAILLEDLMWSAAFRADERSFERGVRNQAGRGALERRLVALRPLAKGDITGFLRGIDKGLDTSPSETLRFLDQMVQRIEREDGDVRTAHRPTLVRLNALLDPLTAEEGGGRSRKASILVGRSQAIIEGLGGLGPEASPRDRARSLAPTGEVFAGSVRLAPADPLPWPFLPAEPPAPSIFTQLDLTPVEWRDGSGELVFGWSIGG